MKRGGVASLIWTANSPHTEQYSQLLNASYYPISYFKDRKKFFAPLRYLFQGINTWWVLGRQRPHAVHVINTPVFAPIFVYLYCLLTGSSYILDILGHSMSGPWAWTMPIQKMLAKRALVNIVDQVKHENLMKEWGVNYVMLERPPVGVPSDILIRFPAEDKFVITVINIFAADEPVDLIVEAARQLPDVEFHITGNTQKADPELLANAPNNVEFTGYISGNDYWNQLNASHAIMTLTTAPYSLVSGGVEAMAMHKPAILSRQPALVDYFTKGTVFVDHTVESMVAAVRQAQEQEETLKTSMAQLACEKQERWHKEFQKMLDLIGEKHAK